VSTLGGIAWWVLLGALLGWLSSWLVGRLMRSPVPAPVDEAAYRTRIAGLQNDFAVLAATPTVTAGDYRRRIARLEDELAAIKSAPARLEQRIVEKPVERVVERIVPDLRAIEERDAQLRALRQRLDHLQPLAEVQRGVLAEREATIAARAAEIARLAAVASAEPAPALDREAARAAGFSVRGVGDLEVIEGIGPRITELLRAQGIDTFHGLANTPVERLHAILDQAGPAFRLADPATWPEQSALAAFGQWGALRSLQDSLDAGKR